MKKAPKPKLLKCPCCKELQPESECCVFISQIAYDVPANNYGTLEGRIIGNLYWIDAQQNKIYWACDKCLQQNRALRGKLKQQLFCDFAPHFAYFDKQIICRDCGTAFQFLKEEQAHYYEKLGFWVQAERVRCNACIALKKMRERISQLLVNPDYNNLEQVQEIVKLRLTLKQYRQAKQFLTIGKKNHITGSISYLEFESLKDEILKAERVENDCK